MKYITKLPFEGEFYLTFPYGAKNVNIGVYNHKGTDLVGINTNVYSIVYGIVSYAGWNDYNNSKYGFGKYVSIKFDENKNGYKKVFLAHLKSFNVKKGDRVTPATIIGKMGSTGNSTGAHTHVEIREYDKNNKVIKIINSANYMGIPNKIGKYNSKDFRIYLNNYTIGRYKVNSSNGINVREGPSINFNKVPFNKLTENAKKQGGYINNTIFDVFEVNNNWGKTPSGWVCLDYATKL